MIIQILLQSLGEIMPLYSTSFTKQTKHSDSSFLIHQKHQRFDWKCRVLDFDGGGIVMEEGK